jgi:hypothetical protein
MERKKMFNEYFLSVTEIGMQAPTTKPRRKPRGKSREQKTVTDEWLN